MVLVKKLTKIGNSWGAILPSDILKMAGIKREYEIHLEKRGVLLSPHFPITKKDQKVMETMAKFIKKYHTDLKKLA
jgi:antitoxin component of MazEF toxin-antitoxin module